MEIAVAYDGLDYRPDKLIVVLGQLACDPGCFPEFTGCEEQEDQ